MDTFCNNKPTGQHCSNCLEGRKCSYWKEILDKLGKEEVNKQAWTGYYDPAYMDRRLVWDEVKGVYEFFKPKSRPYDKD